MKSRRTALLGFKADGNGGVRMEGIPIYFAMELMTLGYMETNAPGGTTLMSCWIDIRRAVSTRYHLRYSYG